MTSRRDQRMFTGSGERCSQCGELLAIPEAGHPIPHECPECARRSQPGQPSRLTLTITGTIGSIEPALDQIIGFVRLFGCSGDDELNISLALQEALANAVVHGCHKDPAQLASCSVECDRTGVLITIRDPGKGFDPLAVEDCTSPERLLLTHGRGLAMIRAFMDEVSFENHGSVVHMRKRFTSPAH